VATLSRSCCSCEAVSTYDNEGSIEVVGSQSDALSLHNPARSSHGEGDGPANVSKSRSSDLKERRKGCDHLGTLEDEPQKCIPKSDVKSEAAQGRAILQLKRLGGGI
jgi:hypothetical protein